MNTSTPVTFRIEYNVSLLTHQCIHGHAPPYLQELLGPRTTSRTLRCASAHTLRPPKTKLRTIGDRLSPLLPQDYGMLSLTT